MSCPKCNSENTMERKGILNSYHDIVCLDCGNSWKPKKKEESFNHPLMKKMVRMLRS